MALNATHPDEIEITNLDNKYDTLRLQRIEHLGGEVSFFTTWDFDGLDSSIRISPEDARALHAWLGEQLAK